MVSLISKCSVLAVLAVASAVAQNAPDQKPPDSVLIPQMTPEELPARAPRVSYRNGQLQIDAENASLAEVLTTVAKETGAQIDQPPDAATERVMAHLSGAPRQVMAGLLDGAKYGYIILSPLEDANGLQTVIITGGKDGSTLVAARQTGAPVPESGSAPGPTPRDRPPTDGDGAVAAAEQPAPTTRVSALQIDAERERAAGKASSGDAIQPSGNTGPSQSAPMQVLQDLYRLRQQQMQQQQSQPLQQQQHP